MVKYVKCKPPCWFCGTRVRTLTDGKNYSVIFARKAGGVRSPGWIRLINDLARVASYTAHHFVEVDPETEKADLTIPPRGFWAGTAGEDIAKGDVVVFGESGLLYRKKAGPGELKDSTGPE